MARRFTAASSDYIALTTPTFSAILRVFEGSLVIWFRSTATGTTAQTFYSERTAGSGECHISLNDGLEGRLKATLTDDVGVTVTLSHDGAYNDGAWHMVEVRRYYTTVVNHRLRIDGVERANNTTDNLTPVDATARNLGRRVKTASEYFDGDIADVAMLATNGSHLSDAQHDTLYARTKHICNASSLGLMSWTANVESNPRDAATYEYLTASGTSLVNGPNGDSAPAGMTAITRLDHAWLWEARDTLIVTSGSVASDADRLLREMGNVIYTPEDTARPYKYFYTGCTSPYNEPNTGIFMAYSKNRVTWAKGGNVVPNAILPSEDPYVVDLGDGTLVMFCENKRGGSGGPNDKGIARLASTDHGNTWAITHETVLDKGTSGTWDDADVSSPAVIREGSTLYMLYEGRSGGNQRIGLATSSDGGVTWTKDANNPLKNGAGTAYQAIPDELTKIGSTYYCIYHSTTSAQYIISATTLNGAWVPVDRPRQNAPKTGEKTMGSLNLLTGDESKLVAGDSTTGNLYVYQMYGDPSPDPATIPILDYTLRVRAYDSEGRRGRSATTTFEA